MMTNRSILMALGLCLLPGLALAGKKQDCETYGYLAQQVADLRASGADKADATEMVVGTFDGSGNKFSRSVPILADWVFSLEENQLSMDVEGAYKSVCLAN